MLKLYCYCIVNNARNVNLPIVNLELKANVVSNVNVAKVTSKAQTNPRQLIVNIRFSP